MGWIKDFLKYTKNVRFLDKCVNIVKYSETPLFVTKVEVFIKDALISV